MSFAPLAPWWLLAIVGLAFAAAFVVIALRDPRLFAARLPAALVIALVIANPVVRQERRALEPDIAVALIDRSASMAIGDRASEAARALAALREATPGVEWSVAESANAPGETTRLGAAIDAATAGVPQDRLAGIVVISDGISAEAPDAALLPPGKPLHLLLAGDPATRDRRLVVERAPAYSVVGRTASIGLRIDDGDEGGGSDTVRLTIEADGRRSERDVPVGEPFSLPVPVTQRGIVEVALGVAPLAGEATLVNNRALVRLNGVTDRLRVLLVSGVPYAGGRAWRDILKSDANVDLVHFTILRLPTSFDMTSPDDMSLIPFPVEELFRRHLPEFDLIIFDRFGLSELLSPIYFQSLADRVRAGGGLFVVTGEEFAQDGGLADTPLADLLPARPAGPSADTPFRPELTSVGERHPVTAALAPPGAPWGRWGSQSRVEASRGQVLMTGVDNSPLLILDRVGSGRVGLLASTSAWWWSRSVDGAGPRDELLRRIAHWLMREPDLDENRIDVDVRGRRIEISARGVDPPSSAIVTGPGANRAVPLQPAADGVSRGRLDAGADGLFRISAAGRTRFALAGETAELAEVRPRAAPLSATAAATGGGVFPLSRGLPRIERTDPGDPAAGPGWLGLVANRAGAIVGVDERPLIPPAAVLALVAAALVFAWWRERR